MKPMPHPVMDPFTSETMCWCGLLHTSPGAAALCVHQTAPYIPGEPSMRRPGYVPTGSRYVPGPRTYRRRRLLRLVVPIMLALVLAALLIGLGLWWASAAPAAPAVPASLPTTYGPPGPAGGPIVVVLP